MKWYVKVLNQYADFKGRASREEFWMYFLFNILATLLIGVIGFGLMTWTEKTGAIVLPLVYSIAVMIPSCAVIIRRLHDTDRNAWFFLVGLIPVIGWIWLWVVLAFKGVPDKNKYGKNPLTTTHSHYFRRRSAAVALIFSSVFWLGSCVLQLSVSYGWNDSQILSILLPVGLIIIGSLLFSKQTFHTSIALLLFVLSAFWLFRDVLEIRRVYYLLFDYFNILLLIRQFVFFIPVALLLSGIYIVMNKTDRTVPACLLFAGSFIWIFNIIWDLTQFTFPLNNTSDYLSLLSNTSDYLTLLSNTILITVPVSLLVFARTLLSKEKSVKELMHISDKKSNESVPKQMHQETDIRLKDNAAQALIAPPEAAPKASPVASPPEAAQKASPVASPPEAAQKASPVASPPEAAPKASPVASPPEAAPKASPVASPPEAALKASPVASPPEAAQKASPVASPPEAAPKASPIASPPEAAQKASPVASPPEAAQKASPIASPPEAALKASPVASPPEAAQKASPVASPPEAAQKASPVASPPEAAQKASPIVSPPEAAQKASPVASPPEAAQKASPVASPPEAAQKASPVASPPEATQKASSVASPPEAAQKASPVASPPEAAQKASPVASPPEAALKVDTGPLHLQPIVSENRRKVVFIREDKDDINIWVIYKAPTKVDAMAFLSKITVDQPSYFVVVETPEGNYGRDKDGIYQE